MRPDLPLSPWPRLRQAWWVYGLAAAVVGLHCVALLVRVRCSLAGRCGGPVARLLDPDAVEGLPRLATAALFAGTAALAWGAARRSSGRAARWWTAVAGAGAGLALLKLVSAHSVAKNDSFVLTLTGSVLIAAAALAVLRILGRRWDVPATGPVVLALALYAGAALGLDAVTWLMAAVQQQAGAVTEAAGTFAEELGEALTALALLVTVCWQAGAPRG
jgi:hypothetical protein